jgi:hypothetical protein
VLELILEHLRKWRSRLHQLRRQIEKFNGALIADLNRAIRGHHDEALIHVVERRLKHDRLLAASSRPFAIKERAKCCPGHPSPSTTTVGYDLPRKPTHLSEATLRI